MKGVILAAGKGARLNGSAGTLPKCLLRIGGMTLVERQIATLRGCGIDDISVVVGCQADRVRRTCGRGVTFVENTRYAQTNSLYSLWLARPLLTDGVVVANCDVLLHPRLVDDLLTAGHPDALLVAFQSDDEPLGAEEMKVRINRGRVVDISKEMAPEEGEEPPPEGSMGSSLDIAYEIALAQDDLISVELDVGSYYQGAAHPNSYTETINYDLKNGKQLKLSDLFKPGAKYLQAIATYSIADLKKQQSTQDKGLLDSQIEEGAAPSAKNYDSWKITKQGLGINFDAYQVGPYAAGPQFVLVPYANLKDLINPEGAIAQFAK